MGSRETNGRQMNKEKEEDTMDTVTAAATAVAAAIGAIGVAAWGVSKLFGAGGESSDDRKTMKAPGRDGRIFRDDFERDPKDYFRNLRGK